MSLSYATPVPTAGVDEAGRGCLAGPVVAAAVVLPPGWQHPALNDSKQVARHTRQELAEAIKQVSHWAIGTCSPAEIDQMNILQASVQAMHRALQQLQGSFQAILVDGNYFHPFHFIPHQCVVKGDSKVACIAAASIVAKVHRDELMQQLGVEFPHYGWQHNAGYPTQAHRQAIAQHGPCLHHRFSFRLLRG